MLTTTTRRSNPDVFPQGNLCGDPSCNAYGVSDEPFTAFGHRFSGDLRPWREDLASLEYEGAT